VSVGGCGRCRIGGVSGWAPLYCRCLGPTNVRRVSGTVLIREAFVLVEIHCGGRCAIIAMLHFVHFSLASRISAVGRTSTVRLGLFSNSTASAYAPRNIRFVNSPTEPSERMV
jgi:hypothetical protein